MVVLWENAKQSHKMVAEAPAVVAGLGRSTYDWFSVATDFPALSDISSSNSDTDGLN